MNIEKFEATIKVIPGLYTLYVLARTAYSILSYRSLKTILFSPPGHFYSPLPDLKHVQRNADQIFKSDRIQAIDINEGAQLKLLANFQAYCEELPFNNSATGSSRYYYENCFFGHSDAIILYSFLRHFNPKRVVEVGSGFSSAAMLDTNEHFLDHATHFTFIEPHCERLKSLLTDRDRQQTEIIESPVQDVSIDIFRALGQNDILFIDSSHVVKVGSDVQHILFNILPALEAGVIVHFHDIQWPFEYPKSWIMEGRAWNETYFLRAFLQYNNAFEIMYFNSYMGTQHVAEVRKKLPLCLNNTGGSIWLRKIA
jgi:predicted O-methyltransferase YrrM